MTELHYTDAKKIKRLSAGEILQLRARIIDLTLTRGEDEKRIATLESEVARLTAGSEAMQRDAANNTITIKMLMAQLAEMKAPIEDIKIYCNNPSAWEHYDDGVSEKIRAILKAAGMA